MRQFRKFFWKSMTSLLTVATGVDTIPLSAVRLTHAADTENGRTTMKSTTETKLIKGAKYDRDSLVVSDWTGDSEGLYYGDYFADGVYLGPDADGVEPLFTGRVDPVNYSHLIDAE